MKRFRIYIYFMFMMFSAFLFACTYSSDNNIELNQHEIYLQIGETFKLEVETDSDKKVSFSSENDTIAIIDENGEIEAINNGKTKIIITQGNETEYCYVYVGLIEPTNIYILSYDNLNLTYGDEEVEFKVIFDNIVSSSVYCDWYLNDELYLEKSNTLTFIPNKIGYFEIYAKYKEIKSNDLYINVDKAKIVIDANNVSVDYLEDEVELSYKISQGSLCYDDKFVGEIVRELGSDAGEYKISQGNLTIVNNNAINVVNNYDFIFNDGKYVINKIPQLELKDNDVYLNVSSTKITINSEVENLEYSLDKITWQDENIFDELDPNTDYNVFVRIKETINHISSGVLELNAHTLKQYKITTFGINGNPKDEEYIELVSEIYDEGTKLDLVLDYPIVKGYTFSNYRFIIDNEEITNQNEIHLSSINQDINIYLDYDINIYNIKFISHDREETYSYKYLDEIKLPVAGEKLGYVFTCWINENEDLIDDTYLVEESFTLTAQYEVKNFVVAFYNSSQMIYSEVVAAYDKLTQIPENPAQEGYKFKGWNTKLDGSGTYYYTVSDLTKIKGDLYLFAVYEIEVYTISYLDYDGTLLFEEKVEFGNRALYDVIPEREGYIFIGWSLSLDRVTSDLEVTALYQEL